MGEDGGGWRDGGWGMGEDGGGWGDGGKGGWRIEEKNLTDCD